MGNNNSNNRNSETFSNVPGGIVKPELLVSELLNEITDTDYLAKTYHFLQNNSVDLNLIERKKSEDILPHEDIYKLMEPGYLIFENGISKSKSIIFFIQNNIY